MLSKENQEILELFARVLEYPTSSLVGPATDCARRLADSFSGSAAAMQSFATFANGHSQAALEELYFQTFDVTPATTLYFGYHLFGDTPKRSAFLVQLMDAYQAHSFSNTGELADHLCVLLRFLSVTRDTEFAVPLLEECLLPTLERIENTMKKDKNVYRPVITALRAFLQQVSRSLVKAGGLRV